ncbi:hypothetical protein Vretimale_11512 [Volvox reticuliferus]|uniref:Peptidase S8/S53 domain-containing protein n=1 Tax=Volvox reticuliferus TaxID=1737510 RepID=A0A8J4CN78_9CHLO|nr:hypothetical protein Vretifemale_14874 [Volvox reticuliferus]GIM07418.1 hypothetical protein Vretimale_11512 [Volvox reticuliferus]
MIHRLCFAILGGILTLRLASGGAALLSNSPLSEDSSKTHVVNLRTGTVDVAAVHDRLPLPTPTIRRALLQQQQLDTSSPPTQAPEWGPLAQVQLWFLTLGPTLHWHEDVHRLSVHTNGAPQHRHIDGRPSTTIAAAAAAAGSPLLPQPQIPQFGEAQARLMTMLHTAGCVLVSFLPPAAWLLAVADDADLTPVLEAFPDVRLAPYGPPSLRVAPELAATLDLMRQAGNAVAERIAMGDRLDELMDEALKEKSGWLLGAMRLHVPTRGSFTVDNQTVGDGINSGSSRIADGKGKGKSNEKPAASGTHPARVQVEVQFPHLEPSDLAILSGARQSQGADFPSDSSSSDGNTSGSSNSRTARRGRRYGQHDDGTGGVGDSNSGGSSYHPAVAAATDWLVPLTALSPPDCPPLLAPDFGSQEVLLVSVCPVALEVTVEWLAAAPQVSWIAPRMVTRLHNLVAGAIVQTGGNNSAALNETGLSAHPFWAAGLTGANQIVGCGDSGLDFGNCFFADPSVDVSANTQTDNNGMPYFSSTNHRKLRYYLALVQDMVDSFGHGTHVSGTLVGSRFDKADLTSDPLAPGTGQAPAAKIAFMDLSRGNSDGVWTPGDLYRSYFNLTYRIGARVHSDSWGSELTAYDSMSVSLDRFTFNNQDFVSVFAAGNYGDKSSTSAKGTVTSPAVAKNCIAVGATLSTKSVTGSSRPTWVAMSNMTVILDLAGGQHFTRSVRVVKATNFGEDMDKAGLSNSVLALANPENACAALANAGAVSGKVLLVQRGGCYFTDKAQYAEAAGARAIIVYNDVKDSGYFSMSAPSGYVAGSIHISAGSVPLSIGLWLKSSIAAGTVTLLFKNIVQPDYPFFEDVAAYSSVGPTTDGRIKPDIVAPGTLLSANSSKTVPVFGRTPSCDRSVALTTMSGTSMATPVVAGSALLVRQYFVDGFYPDGVRNPAKGFQPSGPLIKAVLLGGADHMTGVVADSGMPLEDAPSYRQGFGRLSLLHSLPLAGNLSPGWRLQLVDGASLAVSEQHQFCVTATGGPLRITLAWYDYPGDQAAARALVNNLDLQVRAAGRGLLLDYGNGVQDNVNTVEQVWYDDLPAGDVAITVMAVSIFQKSAQQLYALVVQGKFSGSLRVPSSNTPSNTCAAQLAVILDDMSSAPITNSKNLTFYYTTQDANTPQASFQCRLIPEGVNSTAWESCSMPSKTYLGVEDGRYSFQVRVAGELVAAVRSVLVDSVPPVITLKSSLSGDSTTASDNITFIFTATDTTSAVTFTCFVSFSNGPNNSATAPYLRFGGLTAAVGNSTFIPVGQQVPIRTSFPCNSPLELIGMSFGDYSLRVKAVDAAQNGAEAQLNWKIRYNPNKYYARVVSGPIGLVTMRQLSYGVIGFNGSQAQSKPPEAMKVEDPQAYEYMNVPLPTAMLTAESSSTGSSGGSGKWTLSNIANSSDWMKMEAEDIIVDIPSDGSYLVVVRPLGSLEPVTWGSASVQVDSTPPVVIITRAPNSFQSDPRVTIKFGDSGTDDDTRAFFCRWLGDPIIAPNANTSETSAPYTPCRDTVTFNVTEGYWLFQVKGQDAAGNIGYPANATFVTDLQPPAITTNLTSIVNVSRLAWDYSISDTGSDIYNGSVNTTCLFRWVRLDNASVTVDGDVTYPAARQNPEWMSPCPPPPIRYALQEGSYRWSVAANDRAGLKATQDFTVLADFSKPVSLITSPSRTFPSKFTLSVISRDLPKTINSGVVMQECKIETVSAPPPASPPPSLSSPPPAAASPSPSFPSGSNNRAASARPAAAGSSSSSSGEGGSWGSRRAVAQLQGTSSIPRLYNGASIAFGAWHVCDNVGSAVNITYDGFSTGYYTFSIRATDAAGNQGNASPSVFFAVDATLKVDAPDSEQVSYGEEGGSSNRTKKIVIGVAILIGALVLIVSAVLIFVARRRYLKKHAGPPPPPSQLPPGLVAAVAASHGVQLQPVAAATSPPPPPPLPPPPPVMPYNGNGNGYSNGSHAPPSMVNTTYAGPPVVSGLPLSSPVPAVPVSGSVYSAQSLTVPGRGVVAGMPVTSADPALAAALAVSAEEAQRSRSAALAFEEEQRLRRAIAVSIEEENMRRAKEASLAAAVQHTTEQAALDAAIAASLATAEQERQRQQQRVAQQAQVQRSPRPPPSAPPAGPPDYGLI